MGISKYLPKPEHIFPVYALIVLGVYGWSIYWFIWNLPSWLSFIQLGDIVGILSYVFAANLLESILFLAALIVLSLLLPAKWMREDFILRAGVTAICLMIFGMYLLDKFVPWSGLGKTSFVFIIIFAAIQFLAGRIPLARRVIAEFADRAVVFIYISIPLSILGLLNLILRNYWSIR